MSRSRRGSSTRIPYNVLMCISKCNMQNPWWRDSGVRRVPRTEKTSKDHRRWLCAGQSAIGTYTLVLAYDSAHTVRAVDVWEKRAQCISISRRLVRWLLIYIIYYNIMYTTCVTILYYIHYDTRMSNDMTLQRYRDYNIGILIRALHRLIHNVILQL